MALVALGREAQTPESAVGGGGGGGDDTPVGAIVGSVLGVLAVLVLAGLACALLALRRRRARKGATKSVDRDASDSAKLRAYTVPMLAAGKRSMARTDVDSAGAMSATTEHVSMRTPVRNPSQCRCVPPIAARHVVSRRVARAERPEHDGLCGAQPSRG